MIHFVYLSIIVGILFLLYLYYKDQEKNQVIIATLTAELELADNENKALDKGFVEATDAYETDSLQYEDTIEKLNEKNADLQRRNDEQAATIDGLRRANDEYFQENVGIRRQLDIAQVVISQHDLNCLPHIILKSMPESEQDTPLPI